MVVIAKIDKQVIKAWPLPTAKIISTNYHHINGNTVRPRDTRPQAALTSTIHYFELGPKFFEMHYFDHFSFSSTILNWVLEMH